MSYWKQQAATWVSVSVLAGGLVSALILLMLARIESRVSELGNPYDGEIFSDMESPAR